MTHRYTIMGKPYGSDREIDLVQCDSNPQALLDALKAKTLVVEGINKRVLISKYTWLRIMDHGRREDHVQP